MNAHSITHSGLWTTAIKLGLLLVLLLALVLFTPRTAHAAQLYWVKSTADTDGLNCVAPCTLRQAINAANNHPGHDDIAFAIPGNWVNIITLSKSLPPFDDLSIQGYSQPGAKANTLAVGNNAVLKIQIDGGGHDIFGAMGSGNQISGLALVGAMSAVEDQIAIAVNGDNNTITGNFIGVNVIGVVVGNGHNISLEGNNNRVGGTKPEERNVISSTQTGWGIHITGYQNIVQGNHIGTEPSGMVLPDSGNALGGVLIFGGGKNVIGGNLTGAGNIIFGNKKFGIGILDSKRNIVQGNYIGTTMNDLIPGAFDGIAIENSSRNKIGGGEEGAGNRIAFNPRNGVRVVGGTRNQIRGNSIFSNGELGIDLQGDGVTKNDRTDNDDGPNHLQNFPTLTLAKALAGGIKIKAQLASVPKMLFYIQFFSSPSCDPSGYGEGKTFIGWTGAGTDAAGNATIPITFPVQVPVGHFITAIATDAQGNASEFSKCKAVAPKS